MTDELDETSFQGGDGGAIAVPGSNYDAAAQAKRLKILVEKVGSKAQLSRMSGVPKSTLETFLNGSQMKMPALVQLARAASVSPAWLAFGLTGEERPTEGKPVPPELQLDIMTAAVALVQAVNRPVRSRLSIQQQAETLIDAYKTLFNIEYNPEAEEVPPEDAIKIILEAVRMSRG